MDQLTLKTVKTRKPHNCWGCAKEFPAGTEMTYSVSVDQREFSSCYWCKDCEEILNSMEPWEYEDGFAYGELIEYAMETGLIGIDKEK